MGNPTMPLRIQIVLGSLFVLLHAVHRFNTPPTNRSSTTAARYYGASLVYGALLVVTYLLFVFSPLLAALARTGAHLSEEWTTYSLSDPLLIALLLTILLPTLPILEPLDEWIRKGLRTMAAIPHEAKRLAAEMRRAPYTVPKTVQQRVRDELARQAFDPGDAAFDQTETLHGSWTKLTALILQLNDWEGDRRFSGFVSRFRDDYRRILRRYEQFAPKVRKWFRTAREFTFSNADNVTELAREYQADILQQGSDILQELYTFLSRGLLKCELTYASRTTRLRTLGFDLSVHRPRLTLNRIMMLFGSISLIFIFGLTFLQEWLHLFVKAWFHADTETRPTMGLVLSRTIMIAVIYVVATWCAIFPKERWAVARRQPEADRPVFAYFLASTAAAVLSLIISFAFGLVTQLNVGEACALFAVRYPWALMSFMTAFVSAWLADDPPAPAGETTQQRRREGLVQAAASVVTAAVVLTWLSDVATSAALPGGYTLPDPFSAMLRAAVIGYVIGYNVPTWYREAPREPQMAHEAALALPAPH
jgi:hypothetical protein